MIRKQEKTRSEAIESRPIRDEREREKAYALRFEVFVIEQGCPPEEEIDDIDPIAVQLIAIIGDEIAGTARVFAQENEMMIGRVAVKRDRRREGIGKALMDAAHRIAEDRGYATCVLHAQTHALGFYESLGYEIEGELFYEAGIPHRLMKKRWVR